MTASTFYIHLRRRIHQNMISGRITIATKTHTKTGRVTSVPIGSGGMKKFIPKNPTTNESGIKSVVMIVNVFMTSFMRLLIADR